MIETGIFFGKIILVVYSGIFLMEIAIRLWRKLKLKKEKRISRKAAFEDLHKILALSESVDTRIRDMENKFIDFAQRLIDTENEIQKLKAKKKNKEG